MKEVTSLNYHRVRGVTSLPLPPGEGVRLWCMYTYTNYDFLGDVNREVSVVLFQAVE